MGSPTLKAKALALQLTDAEGGSPMDAGAALRTYRRQRVESASPSQLVGMLYEAAVRNCGLAREAMARHDYRVASRHLVKVQDILVELMGSLDVERGGDLATKLMGLYEYMFRRILLANVRKESAAVQEVEDLLAQLRDAWGQAMASNPMPMIAKQETGGPVA